MTDLCEISSANNPRVKRIVRLRSRPAERRAAGVLFAEGFREVQRALDAGLACRAVWTCPAQLDGRLLPVLPASAAVATCPARVFEKITWHRRPEGVLAEFTAPRRFLEDLPPPRLDALYLVAVETQKPGNLGAMVRTASAAGCAAVLAVGPHVDPFHPAAIRNSTAAVFSTPVVAVADPCDAIAFLKAAGAYMLAAVVVGDSAPRQDPVGPVAVVIGPEDRGLSDVWVDAADATLAIPMAPGPVDSLNAAAAAAILLFTVRSRLGQRAAGSGTSGCRAQP